MSYLRTGATCALIGACIIVGACGGESTNTVDGGNPDTGVDVAQTADAKADVTDAGPADVAVSCDTSKPWGAPQLITSVNTAAAEVAPRLSWDELTLVFDSNRSDASASGLGMQIMVAHRTSLTSAFDAPIDLPVVNVDGVYDAHPMLSKDGLTLFLASARGGQTDIWLASRSSPAADFGVPSLVAQVNSPDWDDGPFLSADGTELWLRSYRAGGAGGSDIYRATGSVSGGFSTASQVAELATAMDDSDPALSADGLTIYFASTRTDGNAKGKADIWSASRATLQGPFTALQNVAELNTASDDIPGWVSPDNCRLYLSSDRGGNSDLYVATRKP